MTTHYPQLIVHTDGGSRGNPGPSAVGVVIQLPEGKVLESFNKYIGETTNNQAEYRGVLAALDLLSNYDVAAVRFVLDSELVVKQLNGLYKMKNADLKPLHTEILSRTGAAPWSVEFTHVLRAENKLADAEVNKALDERM